MTTNSSGGVVSEMRYYPYGETDWSSGTMATDRRFTGQREEIGLGLYDYVARRCDPWLGRFTQADTVVPEPGNPQAWNRYAYVLNSPLGSTDPTGHAMALIDPVEIDASRWSKSLVVAARVAGYLLGGTSTIENETLALQPSANIPIGADYVTTGLTGQAAGNVADDAARIMDDIGPEVVAPQQALAAESTQRHHLFPQQFRPDFARVGIDIDQHTVALPTTTHLSAVHRRGGFVGPGNVDLPGQWNQLWTEFWDTNPDATAKEAYQFAGRLMDEFGLDDLPIEPYR